MRCAHPPRCGPGCSLRLLVPLSLHSFPIGQGQALRIPDTSASVTLRAPLGLLRGYPSRRSRVRFALPSPVQIAASAELSVGVFIFNHYIGSVLVLNRYRFSALLVPFLYIFGQFQYGPADDIQFCASGLVCDLFQLGILELVKRYPDGFKFPLGVGIESWLFFLFWRDAPTVRARCKRFNFFWGRLFFCCGRFSAFNH